MTTEECQGRGRSNVDYKTAKKILEDNCSLDDENGKSLCGGDVVGGWQPGDASISLDGVFIPDQLEAFAWWVRYSSKVCVNRACDVFDEAAGCCSWGYDFNSICRHAQEESEKPQEEQRDRG